MKTVEKTNLVYSPSSDKCSVNIYVTNNSNQEFSLATPWRHHGKTVNNPSANILANSGQTLIATFGKESGYGPMGMLTYTSSDGTSLIFYYNNPENGEMTTSTSEENQSFYAMIQPPSGSSGTSFYLSIDNFTMNLNGSGYPEPETVMNPEVTINII
jgi:hypothetical protein